MSEEEKKNNSVATAATTTSSSTSSSVNQVNIQKIYPLEKDDKINDELAKRLIESGGSFLKERDKDSTNELKIKINRLVITLGIVQSHSSRNQLLELIKFFKDKKKYIDLDNQDEEYPFMAFFHFDKEMLAKDIYKDKQQVNKYYKPYENSFSGYYFGTVESGNKNVDTYMNDFANSYHMFIPSNLYSSYENKKNTYEHMEFAKSKGTFYKYGEGCPPVEGSAYEALAKFIQEMNFDEIYVYNCAYWVANIPKYKPTGQINKYVNIIQNTYFEGMCELLNILIHTPSTTKKFILDSEFRELLGRNVYSHRNRKGYRNSKIIEYPFNETTAFKGGKQRRKTQKLRKNKKRTYKNRL